MCSFKTPLISLFQTFAYHRCCILPLCIAMKRSFMPRAPCNSTACLINATPDPSIAVLHAADLTCLCTTLIVWKSKVIRWSNGNLFWQADCIKLQLLWQAQPRTDGFKSPPEVHHHVLHPLILQAQTQLFPLGSTSAANEWDAPLIVLIY